MVSSTPDVRRGDIWLADLGEPVGSVAGYVRPVVVVQSDHLNESRLPTFLIVPITSNLRWAPIPTNLLILSKDSGLDFDSVAQPTLMLAADRSQLIEKIGGLSDRKLTQLLAKLDIALGRA